MTLKLPNTLAVKNSLMCPVHDCPMPCLDSTSAIGDSDALVNGPLPSTPQSSGESDVPIKPLLQAISNATSGSSPTRTDRVSEAYMADFSD